MEWIKKLRKSDSQLPPEVIAVDENAAQLDTFKSHWVQINDIISATNPRPAFIRPNQKHETKIENMTVDDVEAVRNLLEQMIFLLIEEQCSGQLLGPILDYTITQGVFEKLANWCDGSSTLKQQMLLHLLKVYEVLISQAQHSLLHHKQLVSPMLKILSFSCEPQSEELDGHMVLLLNLLCVWMHRDPTLVEVFFDASSNHGPANFLIFSLLIDYIHREGTVGQQARDALLLCMALSAENQTVAKYIVENSNFCPVLATGLSALYSTLPRHMEVRADDWHCLQRSDWSQVPELTNFMNSFEFCNSVVEVAHSMVSDQLLEYVYNGFLVSVFGPSLHKKPDIEQAKSKTSAGEVVVTTAYLNLFLRSVTAPALMRCFLQFLLTHRHDSSLIINTLIQRIASTNRLALVSLSLIRTLVDLNCEDLMLQLVFRYLIPCQHILASQRRSIRDVDIYNASASRFLALTPAVCASESPNKDDEDLLQPVNLNQETKSETPSIPETVSPASPASPVSSGSDNGNSAFHRLSPPPPMHVESSFQYQSPSKLSMPPHVNHATSAFTVNEDLSVTISMHPANGSEPPVELKASVSKTIITSPRTMAEFGPDLSSQLDLNTSYMDYLEDAKCSIDQCREACSSWSAAYDGLDPIDVESSEQQAKKEETSKEAETTKSKENQTEVASGSIPTNKVANESISTTHVASGSIPTNDTPLEVLHSSNDPAMKALSVTNQILNLTALAKQHSNSFSESVGSGSEPVLDNHTNGAETTNNHLSEKSDDESSLTKEDSTIQKCEISITDDKSSSCEKVSANETDGEKSSTENLTSFLSLDSDSEKRPRSGTTSTSMSSVDEFFRSLMEIVPATSKDKIYINKTSKNETSKLEEDFESGIEVSSDGDNQNKEMQSHTADKDSDQNEDSMSQLSLSTDEITETDTTKWPDDVTNDDGEVQKTFSFTDEESEYDDTTSIASSSFYEANEEYGPTEISVTPSVPLKLQGIPYTGPLIGNLFAKLDQMMSNSLYENLLLTGIVARLATYPQPILRSFLLNTHMVFHPSVKSLYQVLNSARNKIDTYAAEISDFKILVRRAQKYLLARGTYPFSGDARSRNSIQDLPMPVPKVKTRTLGGMFKRKKPKEINKKKSSILPTLETLLERGPRTSSKGSEEDASKEKQESASMFYIKQRIQQQRETEEKKLRELRTKNAVYASIVLAEFLKELAAIAQEHAVAGLAA